MFKFEVGQKVGIIRDGILGGLICEIEEMRMSTGSQSVPTYYIRGFWFFEWELEPLEGK